MTNLLLLGFLPSGSEWIIIALVILLLFGGKKIPELMRGLGKGVKSFKEGVNEAKDEINKAKEEVDKPVDNKYSGDEAVVVVPLPCCFTALSLYRCLCLWQIKS